VLFSVWKFRMRPGEEQLDGPPIHGNTRLEVIWTAIPAIVLVALCSYAWVELTNIEAAQPDEMRVNVTGQQFAWTFEYPQPGG
jgi:cytochrome c oxidase subunit 2